MNVCDPTEQQARFDRLEELYATDGRHDPSHPMHALYTGLIVTDQEPADEQS